MYNSLARDSLMPAVLRYYFYEYLEEGQSEDLM
jgi:hypothetical protein